MKKSCPLIFLPLSALNTNFLNFLDQKASTFFVPKRLKPLPVNALRFNQQVLNRIISFQPIIMALNSQRIPLLEWLYNTFLKTRQS
ncbi:MAG: hypothetical protein F6K39_37010 [Okeania sp. SIO3B3]|nr:hypothetical protein [Okeania sp. SIO3B3]